MKFIFCIGVTFQNWSNKLVDTVKATSFNSIVALRKQRTLQNSKFTFGIIVLLILAIPLTVLSVLVQTIFFSHADNSTSSSASATLTITEFPIPTVSSQPTSITAGKNGNVWFAENGGNKIGQITSLGLITEFSIPTNYGYPGITSGPDGNIWVTELGKQIIDEMTPNGALTTFPVNAFPADITSGSDGNLWFTDARTIGDASYGNIGKITTNGVSTRFLIRSYGPTAHITQGPDGNLWFTQPNSIGRITPSGTITVFPTFVGYPRYITSGPDGNLWFTDVNVGKIGRMTTNGTVTEFPIPTFESNPEGITSGPDGNIWFTESTGNKIGRITPSGTITEFAIPTYNSNPEGITSGPDGNIWFTEKTGNKIGRINLAILPIIKNGAFSLFEGQTVIETINTASGSFKKLSLSASGLPTFATFKDNGNNTGTVTLKPIIRNYGNYTFTVKASDGFSFGIGTFTVTVHPAPRIFENFSNGTTGWVLHGSVAAAKDGSNGILRFINPGKITQATKTVTTTALLTGFNTISIRINLHGATLPSGDHAQLLLGWGGTYPPVPLSTYVKQKLNGWQTVTIPLSAFKYFNNTDSFNALGISINGGANMTIDFDDITFIYR